MSTPPAGTFWAKLDANHGRWHPLIAHAADVAAVMERLLADDAPFATRLAATTGHDQLTPFMRALLVQLAAMHDLGKANHGFQERALPRHQRTHQRQGHVGIALRAFSDIPEVHTTIVEALAPLADVPDAIELFIATIAHHGRPLTAEHTLGATDAARSYWLPNHERSPLQEIRRLGSHARRWSGIDAQPPPASPFVTPALTHHYAGLLNLADWIGSTEAAFPFNPDADRDPDAYWKTARARADSACRAIGLIPHPTIHTLPPNPLPHLFPRVFGGQQAATPTPVQHELATGSLPEPGERWVLEAATGSGKTEAALSLYARLRARDIVAGLMFALPTRATARAMHGRVTALLHALHGPTAPTVTLAVGGEAPEHHTTAAITSADTIEYHDDERARTDDLTAWSTSDMRKYLSGEVVVGTIDQALLAALAVRFAHQRLTCLSRHLLVIDEVHAHDDYVLETLRTLLDAHQSANGIALLMSATLPSRALQRLAGHHPNNVPPLQQSLNRPYPALAKLTPQRTWITTGHHDATPARDIRWSITNEADALDAATNAAHQGARVCVLRNTVRDAQTTIDTLNDRSAASLLWRPTSNGPTPAYHARYAQPDRKHLDTAILAAFGKDAPNHGGVILTATQVIEQSLDVDFDLLITDLAPIEILLQRIGRLHRHRHQDQHRPPAYRRPRAIIIAPTPIDPNNERAPRGVGTVYRNLPALELTRRAIRHAPTITLPNDYRSLVEGAYHPDSVDQLRPEPGWAAAIDKTYGTSDAHAFQARQVTLQFERTYHDNHDRYRDEATIRTRLGDDTQRLELRPPARCWYAPNAHATTVELREHYLRGHPRNAEGAPEPANGRRLPDGRSEYQLENGTTLTYESTGWRIQR